MKFYTSCKLQATFILLCNNINTEFLMYFKILSCRDSKEKKIQVSYNSDMTSKDAFLKYKAKISQYSKAQFREETMD